MLRTRATFPWPTLYNNEAQLENLWYWKHNRIVTVFHKQTVAYVTILRTWLRVS